MTKEVKCKPTGQKLCHIIWRQVTKVMLIFLKVWPMNSKKTQRLQAIIFYSMESCMERKLTKHTMSTCIRHMSENSLAVKSQQCISKRKNNLDKLVEIVTRWASHKTAFYTDIKNVQLCEIRRKALAMIYLARLGRCQQNSRGKIIKTLTYGVKSSDNKTEKVLSVCEYP